MSTNDIALSLTKRTVIGKQVRALRRSGKVPAVIYDHGKESIIVEAPIMEVTKVYEKAGKHHAIDLDVENQKYLAIIKDVDFDPRKNTIRHIVFDSLNQNEKVKTEVPIRFEGNSSAEKAGLMLLLQLEVLEVEATPRNLPDSVSVNVETLAEIGDRILVSDLTVPNEVTIITDSEHSVVSVIETPAQQSEEEETGSEEATEETESENKSDAEKTPASE